MTDLDTLTRIAAKAICRVQYNRYGECSPEHDWPEWREEARAAVEDVLAELGMEVPR